MMQKSSLSNFCSTNVRNLKVFLEVHGRDIDFAKSEQSYHLTSTDAEAAAVRLLLPLHRNRARKLYTSARIYEWKFGKGEWKLPFASPTGRVDFFGFVIIFEEKKKN